MKKIFFFMPICLIIFSFNLFSNSLTDEVPCLNENKFKIRDPMQNNFSFLKKFNDFEKYADTTAKVPADLAKIDTTLKFIHASFAGVTYLSLWALDAIGLPLLYLAFNDPESEYYSGLKYAHIAVASLALLSFTTLITVAFTKLGIKLKNGFTIRTTHLTAAIVTLSFYVIELPVIILSAVYFANKYEGAKWVGLAHGITGAATTVAVSVSFVTVFF